MDRDESAKWHRNARENNRRIARFAHCVDYLDGSTEDWHEAIIDLLTDMRHWCDNMSLDFGEAVRVSGVLHDAEGED